MSKVLYFRVPDALHDALAGIAEEQGRSVTKQAERMLQASVDTYLKGAPMKTRTDARNFVTEAINAGDNADNFNVEAIIDECHETAGTWNFEDVPTDAFWKIVENNAK